MHLSARAWGRVDSTIRTTTRLRGLDDTQALNPTDTPSIFTNVPVHNFIDDVSWTKGKHTIQFGTNWRLIHNNRQSNAENLSSGYANLYWMSPSFISNQGVSLDPATQPEPFHSWIRHFGSSYDFAAVQVAGLMSQVYTVTNQDKNANHIPNGALVPRHFHNFEGEMYLQDKWNATPNLTITYGLRYSLLQPPYEADGNQVSPTVDMHQWFDNRITNMYQGVVDQPDLSFDLSGQANGKKPYWAWNYNNVAPRFAIAYAPHADGGFWHSILGDSGKSSIRAGYGMYYDHFGEGVVNTFDRQGSWGLTTTISNPAGVLGVDTTPRYTGLLGADNLPPSPGVPSPHGFPYTPSNDPNTYGLAIAWGIDDNLKTPYSHVVDFSLTRELPHNFVVEATYTGRFAHHLLQEIDLSQPLDLVDPTSKMDYFTASQMFSKSGVCRNHVRAPWRRFRTGRICSRRQRGRLASVGAAPGIPANPTATQNMYDLYYSNLGNETLSLEDLDAFCFPACAGTGSNTIGGFVGPNGHPIFVLPAPVLLALRLAIEGQQQLQRLAGLFAALDGSGSPVRFQLRVLEVDRRRIERRAREWIRVDRPGLQQPGNQRVFARSVALGFRLRHHQSAKCELGVGSALRSRPPLGQ